MFGHKVSKIGYVFCAIGMPAAFLVAVLQPWFLTASDLGNAVFIANLVSSTAVWVIFIGVVMIICGILASGFERVEAAILAQSVGPGNQG